MQSEYRHCSACGEDKPADAFHVSKARYGGRYHTCKVCRAIQVRTPEARAKNRAKNAERYARAREAFYTLKNRPCLDCGGRFPHYVMEFDHPNREIKTGDISRMAMAGFTQKLLDELAHTDLICSNCHKIRTRRQFERGEWRSGRPRFDGTHHSEDAEPYPTVQFNRHIDAKEGGLDLPA